MKYLIFVLAFVSALFITSNVQAFEVPPPTGFVTDAAGVLSTQDKVALENKIKGYRDRTSNEIALLIVKSLDGEDIAVAAGKVFQSWKIGKAELDNGVLFVLSINDRRTRINSGKGVEGDLTDLQTQDILISLRPQLRAGDYAGALNLVVDKIGSTLESRKGQKAGQGKGATFNQPLQDKNSSCVISPQKKLAGSMTLLAAFLLLFGLLVRRALREEGKMRAFIRLAKEEELLANKEEIAHNERVLLDLMKKSLPPPKPVFQEDENGLFKYVSISPLADSSPTLPEVVSRTIGNIQVSNIEDDDTQPNLQLDKFITLSKN